MIEKEILKTVRRIEISTRSTINSVMAGAYHSSFKGNGMEFSEVREYFPGDDVRSIDWNVTARTGNPHVKKYVEERELSVMLMVDASSSADFGSGRQMKAEVMATLSALLAFSAIRNNDKVGLMLFTSEPELFIPPAKGKKHVLRVIRELLAFRPKYNTTDMNAAIEHTSRILKRKSVVMLLSDFMDEGYEKSLRLMRKKHDVVAVGVRDPRELELPDAGLVELEDPETGETVLVDTSDAAFREAYAREAGRDQKEVQALFRSLAVDYVPVTICDDYQDTVAPLLSYFRRRARENQR